MKMNNTNKAIWLSGIFSAVLTAFIISVVDDAQHKLSQAVIDNVRQDAQISHNSQKFDSLESQMSEMMSLAIGTNNVVIRVEERLKFFERTAR